MKKSLMLFALALTCARSAVHGQQAPAPSGGFMEIFLLFIVPFVIIFYFFFIRPQKKQQKQRRDMLEAVEKGDRITTIGGIQGKVTNIAEKTVTLLIDEKNDVKMKVIRRAVASIKGKTEDTDEEETT